MKLLKQLLVVLLLPLTSLIAQNFTGGFNFYLPSEDTVSVNFLPKFPVKEIKDFITIDDEGHFSLNGERVRFWGTNLGADAAFPPQDKCELLAGRMRKFGINLVRLHHLDNPWSERSLLGKTSTRELNSHYLDILENLIDKLKRNGIYINMNLHVSRTFRINDNVPSYDSLPEFGKGVNFFDPYIKSLHKEYAHQLLTHVNPYTGLPLKDDPVMAMLEITNENSLYRFWREDNLKPISEGGELPYRYSKMLDSLWIDFLREKYKNDEALKNAWNSNTKETGIDEQIDDGSFESGSKGRWQLEQHSGASAFFSIDSNVSFNGSKSAKVEVTKSSDQNWHIQFKFPYATIKKDSTYTINFAAMSSSPTQISVSVMNDSSPYTYYSGITLNLNSDWQEFSFSFRAPEDNNGHTRLSFNLGLEINTYWFDNIRFRSAGLEGLREGESLASGNVRRIDYSKAVQFSSQRIKDMSEFYISLERQYFKEMIAYLKDTLGVKVPILTTNWNTGTADLAAMSDGNYVDNHAYWDHPQFPNEPWSSTDWLINNTPMVKDINGGIIPALFAGVPIKGKPFTVSEYNHAFPNRYQVESVLFSTGYASFNDADGFMYFAYDEAYDWGIDRINNFFAINRNSVLMSFFPTIAHVFRNELVKPSSNPIYLSYTADTIYSMPSKDAAGWTGPTYFDRKLALKHSIKTETYFGDHTTDFETLEQSPSNPYKTDTGEIEWDANKGIFVILTERFIGLGGYLSQLKNVEGSAIKVKQSGSGNDFGVITWLSLNDDSLLHSRKSLITIASKIQNSGMVWYNNNTTLKNNWGNSTTEIQPLDIYLELTLHADSIKIIPLNNKGEEDHSKAFIVKPNSSNCFIVNLNQSTYKTLWYGVEAYGEGVPTSIEEGVFKSYGYKLMQNYPNPFNPSTQIEYTVGRESFVSLKVYDVLGREVKTLAHRHHKPGDYSVFFDAADLSAGIYFYRLISDNTELTRAMLLVK
ncbi:carbohydrate binding domain-containing protein [Melioribacter sp. OK-6-Me]|uniref:carbohydrate binding domain-containing protein n=1 Tax=unclassified Melioribacter TaxID=2627329 RepID=UPI003EDAE424